MSGPDAAGQALVAHRDLLYAVNRHGPQLFGDHARVAAVRNSASPDPRDAAAVRLLDALAPLALRQPAPPQPSSRLAVAWAVAASRVRAATDLLATHRDEQGGWRSPEGALLDQPDVRAAGFAQLAALTTVAAGGADHLGLRAVQAGLSPRAVREVVPDPAAVLCAAADVQHVCSARHESADVLAAVEVARPAVRTGEPVTELATGSPGCAASPGTDPGPARRGRQPARLHRARCDRARAHRRPAPQPLPWRSRCTRCAARGSRARRRLATRALAPRPAGHRYPAHRRGTRRRHRGAGPAALARPAAAGARPHPGGGPPAARHPARGTRAMPEIGRWNQQVLTTLVARGELLIPARQLSGEEASERPTLVAAKITNRLVTVTDGLRAS